MTDTAHPAVATLGRQAPSATIDLDLPAVAVALSRRLFAAGLPITPERAVNFVDALALMGPVSANRMYWTARTVFVSDATQLPAFDEAFAAVFAGYTDTAAI